MNANAVEHETQRTAARKALDMDMKESARFCRDRLLGRFWDKAFPRMMDVFNLTYVLVRVFESSMYMWLQIKYDYVTRDKRA